MIWLTWAAPCSQYPPIFTWREGNRGVSRQFLSQWGEGLPVVWKLLSQWPSFSEVRACKQGNLSLRHVYKSQQVRNPILFCFLKKRMILYDGEFGLLPCLTSRFQTKSGKVNLSKFDLSWALKSWKWHPAIVNLWTLRPVAQVNFHVLKHISCHTLPMYGLVK